MSEQVAQEPNIVNVTTPSTVFVTGAEDRALVVTEVQVSPVSTETVQQVIVERTDLVVHIAAAGEQGPAGPAGDDGPPGVGGVETYVAGEDLGGQRVVVTDGSGLAIYADNTTAAHANAATKITTGAAVSGADVDVQMGGRMTEPSWTWTPGGTIYVGVNGLLTQTLPVSPAVFSKPVAVAETATRILIIQEAPILLA